VSRLSHVSRDALPPESRRLFADLERERGFVPHLYAVLAHSPRLLEEFLRMGASMRAPGALPASFKELAILRIAALTGAETMTVSHLGAARAAGLTDAEIAALEHADGQALRPEQRAVIQLVDEVTRNVGASDGAWQAVADFMTEEQLVELTLLVGFYNMVARFLRTVEIDLDPRYASV
jgi:4-carboxymuconolactone decarboxylase